MMISLDRLRRDEGQDLIEYALLVSLISIVSILGLIRLSIHMNFVYWVLGLVLDSKV